MKTLPKRLFCVLSQEKNAGFVKIPDITFLKCIDDASGQNDQVFSETHFEMDIYCERMAAIFALV